ncbi:MAG: 4Fe-4S dicluster domain-containing protein [Myxococcales bacterium]|nr:4Fe-4S dicluster domain-containing protein [Myxococcales bacterium]
MAGDKRKLPVVDAPDAPSAMRVSTDRRRLLLGGLIAAAMGLLGLWLSRARRLLPGIWLRPPGALPEEAFLKQCVRCMKCGNACPNGCIEFHDLKAGLALAFTPFIKPRTRACILCGECGKACPTGALKAFENTRESWLQNVAMGVARVNKAMCYSYHGRTCGACYQACPLAGTAIKIGIFETPIMQPQACVGCGLCEQACLHLPQAIRVIPRRTEVEA